MKSTYALAGLKVDLFVRDMLAGVLLYGGVEGEGTGIDRGLRRVSHSQFRAC